MGFFDPFEGFCNDKKILEAINELEINKANKSDVYNKTETDEAITEKVAEIGGGGAEVYQARVGADGTTYQTLKARLDADTNSQLAENEIIKSDIVLQLEEVAGMYDSNLFDSAYASVVARVPAAVDFSGDRMTFTTNNVGDNIVNVYIPVGTGRTVFKVNYGDTSGFVAYGVKRKNSINSDYEESGFTHDTEVNATGYNYIVLLLRVAGYYVGTKRFEVHRDISSLKDGLNYLLGSNIFDERNSAGTVIRFKAAGYFKNDTIHFSSNTQGTNIANIYIPIERGKTYQVEYTLHTGLEQYGVKLVNSISSEYTDQGFTTATSMTNRRNFRYICVYARGVSTFTGDAKFTITKKEYPEFVTVGTDGDYTSILAALKNTDIRSTILLAAESFDILQEYIDEYGNDYWANYDGYQNPDYFARGLFLADGRRVIGKAGTKIVFNYKGDNTAIKTQFSVFATGTLNDSPAPEYNNLTELRNVEIVFSGCRYAIHDDFSANSVTIRFSNILFNGTPYTTGAIGGGFGVNSTYEISDCVFINNASERDLFYHNRDTTDSAVDSAPCRMTITNCYGSKACKLFWLGAQTKRSICKISNCTFSQITCTAQSASAEVENVVLYSFNNIEGVQS